MSYPSSDVIGVTVTAGPMATAGGKTVSCSNSGGGAMCVAFGVNGNVIGDGVVAVATFDTASGAPDPSAAIQVTGVVTSDSIGNGIPSSGSAGTITISHPITPPALSGVSCTQASITAPGSAACSVTLSSPASASGLGVTLSSNNSNVSVPSPLTVSAGASSVNFTATVGTVSSAQTAILTATAAGVSQTFTLNIVPPPPQTWSISGTISPAANGSGATVTLSGAASAAVTADASGNYTFSALANGVYTVKPSRTGFTFIPTSQSVTINGANLTGIDFSDPPAATGSLGVDVTLWQDQNTPSSNVTSPAFSTVSGNELLLAFIGTDYSSGSNTTVTNVSGGGLNWVLAARTNVQHGTSEIWRAFAKNPLSNVSVTATLSQSAASSMTVMSFTGVDTSGTNGSGAIGATGSGNGGAGGPTATLVTTRNNSWVFGVGNDFTNAIARTPGSGQSLVHQDLPNSSGTATDTFWVQQQNSPTPLSSTTVAINDTAPTSDEYNLSIVEILPALSSSPTIQTWNISGTISPSASGSGATVKLTGAATATVTADASGNYTFSGLANGAYTVTPSKTGFTFTPASRAVTLNSANQTAINFTAQAPTWSISGTISPAATASGATMSLSGAASASVTADASGNYTFNGLANGAYTVTPSKTGYTFTPANRAVTLNSANQTAINFTAAALNQTYTPITTGTVVWRDRSTASFNVSSPGFSTVSGNELLLAFIAADYQWGQNTTVTRVSGAGLTWVLAVRTRVQKGTSEIWQAFAPAPLSNVSVTATLSQRVTSSITVMSFTGVDTSGVNGSGAVGATGSGNASSGAPWATLQTTRNNSLVIGVGNDSNDSTLRTPGAGQSVVHQFLAPNGNTHWVQTKSSPVALSGSSVSVNDTAPTADPYNLSIVEIRAAASGGAITTGAATGAPTTSASGIPRSGSDAPTLASLTMANPANGQTGQVCSPGGLAALLGTGFTTQGPQKATSFPLPTRLAGLQVKVNGVPAPLLFASNWQINFQCPRLPEGSPLEVALEAEDGVSRLPVRSTMQAAAPGVFTVDATNQGAVLIANSNKIAMPMNERFPSKAAEAGDYLTIYATGLGAPADDIAAGAPAPLDRSILLRNKVGVVVGGVEIDPTFAGLAPGTAGLFQINVLVPDSVAPGPEVPMYLKVVLSDGAVLQSNTVTVAISGRPNEP